jgi:hypothetical protein
LIWAKSIHNKLASFEYNGVQVPELYAEGTGSQDVTVPRFVCGVKVRAVVDDILGQIKTEVKKHSKAVIH